MTFIRRRFRFCRAMWTTSKRSSCVSRRFPIPKPVESPASVKACAKPPAGLLATRRIGPCSDMMVDAIPDGGGLQAYVFAINASSTAQAALGLLS